MDLTGTSGSDALTGTSGADTIDGGEGTDTLLGGDGNDLLLGSAGTDSNILEGAYADTLSGGAGDDTLQGGGGNDVYVFGIGDGRDQIFDQYHIVPESPLGAIFPPELTDAGFDTFSFGPGITADDVIFTLIGDDLYVGLREPGKELFELNDLVRIIDFMDSNHRIENFTFEDGSTLSDADVLTMLEGTSGNESLILSTTDTLGAEMGDGNDTVSSSIGDDTVDGGAGNDLIRLDRGDDQGQGGTGNDTLAGGIGDDTLDGGDGNDTLDGGSDDDFLIGGAGNDYILGSGGNTNAIGEDAGEDTLTGGLGNDTLLGGGGNDVYQYDQGDGLDTIQELYNYRPVNPLGQVFPTKIDNAGALDVIEFGGGITADDLVFDLIGNDLYIRVADGDTDLLSLDEGITVLDFKNALHRIEEFRFEDGTTLTDEQVMTNLTGHAGNETIIWTESALGVDAGGGNDWLQGGIHDDTLYGGDGQDTIITGEGFNTEEGSNYADGGAGNDTVWGAKNSDTLLGGDGNDLVDGGEGSDVLSGGAGDDTIEGGSGRRAYYNEGAFDDTLDGGTGNDTLMGGGGNDVYQYREGDGQDYIHDQYLMTARSPLGAITGYYDLDGGVDTISFMDGASVDEAIFTMVGDDLYVGFFQDDADFFSFDDLILIDHWLDTRRRVEEFEFVDDGVSITDDQILDAIRTGTSGNDSISGADIGSRIDGGAGNDVISGGQYSDVLIGGSGNDTLDGGGGRDILSGGAGADALYGGDGADVLVGGAGGDTLVGGAGDDTFRGTASELNGDVISGYEVGEAIRVTDATFGSDDVTISSSNGVSTVSIDTNGDGNADISFNLVGDVSFSNAAPGEGGGTVLTFGEALNQSGTSGDDTLIGTQSGDTLSGGEGNDAITGQGGADVLDGGTGNDQINAGDGADSVAGGEGDDTVDGAGGDDVIDGGAGNDTLTGGDGDDTVLGGTGEDTLGGGTGDDLLDGGADNDTLTAGSGSDTLIGGEGDDLAEGGSGNDLLSGGSGSDNAVGRRGRRHLQRYRRRVGR